MIALLSSLGFEPAFCSLPSKAEIESKMEHTTEKFLPVQMEREKKPQRHKEHKENYKEFFVPFVSLWSLLLPLSVKWVLIDPVESPAGETELGCFGPTQFSSEPTAI
jgi:hypothetical protein